MSLHTLHRATNARYLHSLESSEQRPDRAHADNTGVDLTVAIPSCGRADKLTRLLDSLDRQTIDANRFEVVVGFDGTSCPVSNPAVRVLKLEHAGPASTRNAIVDEAKGDLLLFLNDDVIAAPDLLEQHLAAHSKQSDCSEHDLVLGSAPWVVASDDTLFDRMIRETSMVFFYNTMDDSDRTRDWGFRHAWTLNLSLRTELARQVPFDEGLKRAMFEDLEWAYRLAELKSSRVLYRPEAEVLHDHRYTPEGYLEREKALGAQSLELARVNPECAHAIFRHDISTQEFARSCADAVENDRSRCEALHAEFTSLIKQTPEPCDDIDALYDSFRSLKKQFWRQGLIEASTASGVLVS